MTNTHVETLRKMFALLVNPPEIKLDDNPDYDDPILSIDNGLFWIRDDEINVPSIRPRTAPGFVLEKATYRYATRWEPEEHDYAEITHNQVFNDVATEAVRQYVTYQINGMLEQEANQHFAEELAEEKLELIRIEQEGYDAYTVYSNSIKENPYPYGIAHFYAWKKGWNRAEYGTYAGCKGCGAGPDEGCECPKTKFDS